MTFGRGAQTLGEEYTDILPYSSRRRRTPSRRVSASPSFRTPPLEAGPTEYSQLANQCDSDASSPFFSCFYHPYSSRRPPLPVSARPNPIRAVHRYGQSPDDGCRRYSSPRWARHCLKSTWSRSCSGDDFSRLARDWQGSHTYAEDVSLLFKLLTIAVDLHIAGPAA